MAIKYKAWRLRCAFFIWALCASLSGFANDCAVDKAQLEGLEKSMVKRVIDGDTVVLATGRHVRLLAVNAPEKGQPLAAKATQQLKQWLKGQAVYLKTGQQPQDKYGRQLAHLYLADGQSLEALLLKNALAFPVAIGPNLYQQSCYFALADQARIANQGVWRQYPAKDSRQLDQHDVGFQRVSGRLMSLEKAGRSWWLQLQGNIVLQIAYKDQQYFNWSSLQKLQGQEVEATGWVVDRHQSVKAKKYSPLMLLLKHPAHLRLRLL